MSFITKARSQSSRAKKYPVEEGFDMHVRSLSMKRFQELREQYKEATPEDATSKEGMSDTQLNFISALLKESVCEEDGVTDAFASLDAAKNFIQELSLPLLNALIKTVMKANGGDVPADESFRG
jgi:hypothetical protein